LQTVVNGIEDYSGNTTRFLLIGKQSPCRSGKDKTSLLVSMLDRPGALSEALSILAQRSINLTRIESRPVKDEPGRYLFFIDMLGHMEDEIVREGCETLRGICAYFEWLGSYPRA
jgi:chorismate mutase/prephenate dehydratase